MLRKIVIKNVTILICVYNSKVRNINYHHTLGQLRGYNN